MTIKDIRVKVLKKTQQEMAEFLGLKNRTDYCNRENGKINFKPKEIIKICKWANVNPLELKDL